MFVDLKMSYWVSVKHNAAAMFPKTTVLKKLHNIFSDDLKVSIFSSPDLSGCLSNSQSRHRLQNPSDASNRFALQGEKKAKVLSSMNSLFNTLGACLRFFA